MTKVISYRESPSVVEALDELCKQTERERSYHLQKALERYLAENSWQVEQEKKS